MMPIFMSEASFQSAWFYSLILFFMGVLVLWGAWMAYAPLPRMWRDGQRGTAVTIAGSTAVVVLTLVALLLTVIITLYPSAVGTQ